MNVIKLQKLIICTILLIYSVFHAQKVTDFKTKTPTNEAERKIMLDLARSILQKDYKQEFIFSVNKLNVSSGYAWLESDVSKKDGKSIKLEDADLQDCCHVEVLYKKVNGKWKIQEIGTFSTDVWWDGIWERTKAPKIIFQ